MITFHFVNVGQGNMAVGLFPDGKVLVYDCNITDENETAIFAYLGRIMPKNTIDVFVNSHRDADHVRGIKKLHAKYPITALWDPGVAGNTDAPEYQDYMEIRRNVLNVYEAAHNMYWLAHPGVKVLNGKRDTLSDTNSQSIVLHVDYNGSALLLAGDTDVKAWRDHIVPEVGAKLKSLVLLASHHGSFTFFNDDRDNNTDYTDHVAHINPAITIISVGENSFGHPDDDSVNHYRNHSYGTVQDGNNKIFRTDQLGHMKLDLYGNGSGLIAWNQ